MKNSFLAAVPFMALMTTNPPPNRPMLTRIIEQGTVGVMAAAVTFYAAQQRQAEQIAQLSAQAHRDREEFKTEQRILSAKIDSLTLMVAELRRPSK